MAEEREHASDDDAGQDGVARDVPGPTVRTWGTPNAVLALLLVVLVLLAGLFVAQAPDDPGPDAAAARFSARQRAVVTAAKDEAKAFLAVDHRSLRVQARRVLTGATGDFAQQFRAERADLARSARRTQAVSVPTLRAVAVSRLEADRATVLVAADAQVTNRRTKGQEQARYYRLSLDLERHDGRWLTSRLEFVD